MFTEILILGYNTLGEGNNCLQPYPFFDFTPCRFERLMTANNSGSMLCMFFYHVRIDILLGSIKLLFYNIFIGSVDL